MKNKTIVGALLIFSAMSLKAQETVIQRETVVVEKTDSKNELKNLELGFRYMPSFYSVAFTKANGDVVRGKATLSHGYGGLIGINFSRNVGIQAEVNYNEISQKYKDMNLERQVHISYLNVPVLLSLNTDKTRPVNFNVVAGPQFGINVGSRVNTAGTTTTNGENADGVNATVAAKPGDVGLAYGAGLEFALNRMHTIRLDLGFRGFYGLIDFNSQQTSANPDVYNIQVRAARRAYGGYGGITFMF